MNVFFFFSFFLLTYIFNVQLRKCELYFSSADKVVVSTSCSLLHTAVDLVNETKLDQEIKSWLAFAAQKIVEVNALAKALSGQKDEVNHTLEQCFDSYFKIFSFLMRVILQAYFSSNAFALASRKSSPRVTNEAVQKAVSGLLDFNYVISVFD